MLAMNRILDRARRAHAEDTGAVLVAVVVVMLVGFIAAAAIAASVIFTIQANVTNRSNTQAFIAAESGRDAAVAQLAHAIDAAGSLHCTSATIVGNGTAPTYAFTTYFLEKAPDSVTPTTSDGLSSGCPAVSGEEQHWWVVINSIGTGPGGDTAEIDAVFGLDNNPTPPVSGTMAYFDGEFKATKSTYTGDLVIRDSDPYTCNNESLIDGDLWAVKGNVVLSTDCVITGSVYAFGSVTSSSSGVKVGGDIIAGGNVAMPSNGVVIGGKIHSGAAVNLSNTGSTKATVGGTITGRTGVTIGDQWTKPDGTELAGVIGAAPTFDPTLDDVFAVTKWLEISSSGVWGSTVTSPATTTYSTCDADTIRAELANTSAGRALFDMSGCTDPSGKVVHVTLSGLSYSVARDAVFFVPANKEMDLSISAPVYTVGDPKLLFVHADASATDSAPTHCSKEDGLAISAHVDPRTMIYSPCGLNGNLGISFTGQLYTANSGNHLVLSTFTCAPVGWEPAFLDLSCGIKGDGGALDPLKDVFAVDTARKYQTEQ